MKGNPKRSEYFGFIPDQPHHTYFPRAEINRGVAYAEAESLPFGASSIFMPLSCGRVLKL